MVYGGITPACAGNSRSQDYICRCQGDHPRLRGEQERDVLVHYSPLGSPPLARGTDRVDFYGAIRFRITPACAGNRLLLS